MKQSQVTSRGLHTATTPKNRGIAIEETVLTKLSTIWETTQECRLKSPFYTLLRLLGSSYSALDANYEPIAGLFTNQGICFQIERRDGKYHVVDITVAVIPPRPHKHARDMDINQLVFSPGVLQIFTEDHQILFLSAPACPHTTACNLLANAQEVRWTAKITNRKAYLSRISMERRQKHHIFCDNDWCFYITKEKEHFAVASILPYNVVAVNE